MTKTTTLTCLFLFGVLATGIGQEASEFFNKANKIFETYVEDGKVNYKAIKEDPSQLNEALGLAQVITISKNEVNNYQAFWINAYNLAVIKGVVANYPIKSPLDKAGFFDKVTYELGGKSITLNAIENKLLRGNFPEESRFHFVLVCAGLGCPPIINHAYLPETLDAQLQKQTEISLNNPNFIQVKGNKVQLSQIFEWYKVDFTRGGKSFITYVNQFRKEKLAEKSKIGFYDYNWALNETKY